VGPYSPSFERAKRVSRGHEAPELIRLGGLGERRKLPQRSPGRPGRKAIIGVSEAITAANSPLFVPQIFEQSICNKVPKF
jgi:hypothetical protein